MKKNLIIGAGIAVVLLVAYFVVKGNKTGETSDIIVSVRTGPFKVEIETTGELEAKNSVKILGPTSLREFGIWQVIVQKKWTAILLSAKALSVLCKMMKLFINRPRKY